jgi:hypothetical protein
MSTKKQIKEKLFKKILSSATGDYIIMAETAAAIHPEGWK